MAGSANFEDTTKPNQSPAAGGFDSERRSSGVSARWLLMQSIKSRRKRYEACDDVAGSANFEDIGFLLLLLQFQISFRNLHNLTIN